MQGIEFVRSVSGFTKRNVKYCFVGRRVENVGQLVSVVGNARK
jgi:hypothetical protein